MVSRLGPFFGHADVHLPGLGFWGRPFSSLCMGGEVRHQHPAERAIASAHRGASFLMDDDIARAARAKKGSPFLSTEQAAFYLGLSARRLQQMRADGTGPGFRRHSRYVRYHIDDLDTWSRNSGGQVRRHG